MRYIVYDINGREICRDRIPACGCRTAKYRVLFIFNQDDMLYDIQNLAAAQADAANIDEKGQVVLEQFRNVCTESNIERPIKTIPLAISRCEKILHEWTKFPALEHLSISNQQDFKKEFVMEIMVERHFSSSTAWALMRNIQEYIEMFVLYDWSGITYTDGQKHWAERLQDTEIEIRDLMTYIDDECEAYIGDNW